MAMNRGVRLLQCQGLMTNAWRHRLSALIARRLAAVKGKAGEETGLGASIAMRTRIRFIFG